MTRTPSESAELPLNPNSRCLSPRDLDRYQEGDLVMTNLSHLLPLMDIHTQETAARSFLVCFLRRQHPSSGKVESSGVAKKCKTLLSRKML